ncbi:MAG TPA: DUF456 domain-containing protein, partial [Candidatus Binatia bacterium]|nr:DUF456 domain-containing protein [Candidatus Binatia bacterium]
ASASRRRSTKSSRSGSLTHLLPRLLPLRAQRHCAGTGDSGGAITDNQLQLAAQIMDNTVLLLIIAALLIAAGLAGLVLPALPGSPLLFAGLLLAAWAEDFQYVRPWTLVLIALLAVLTYAVDFWATMFGAKRFGASRRAILGALFGAVIGIFLGFPGVLLGPFIGAVIGELSARRSLQEATRAGIGATVGLVLGAAIKIALAFSMIGIFIVARFFV